MFMGSDKVTRMRGNPVVSGSESISRFLLVLMLTVTGFHDLNAGTFGSITHAPAVRLLCGPVGG